jgi:S2P endopeptidase
MLGLAYIALIFWGLVYVLRIYLSRRQLDALPYTSTRTPRPRTTFRNSHTTLTLEPLRIHISTKLLNRFHERMLRVLHTSSSRGSNVSLWMGLIYDAGSLAGALGQLGALGLALWTVWQLVIRVLSPSAEIMVEPSTSPVLAPQGFMRRAIVSEVTVSSQTLSQDVSLQIIVRSILVLSLCSYERSRYQVLQYRCHICSRFCLRCSLAKSYTRLGMPWLLLCESTIVQQVSRWLIYVSHSTGISIHSVGAYLTVLIPAAFVSLSSDALDSMRVRDKLRVIAAGSFHNLLFYAILSGLAWSGVNSAFVALLGYSDVGGLGLVVARIEEVPARMSSWLCF